MQDLGFEYLSACTKEDVVKTIPFFTQKEMTSKPLLLEIFTNGEDDAKAYEIIRSLEERPLAKIKGKIVDGMRDTLGDNMLRKVHALLK